MKFLLLMLLILSPLMVTGEAQAESRIQKIRDRRAPIPPQMAGMVVFGLTGLWTMAQRNRPTAHPN